MLIYIEDFERLCFSRIVRLEVHLRVQVEQELIVAICLARANHKEGWHWFPWVLICKRVEESEAALNKE